MSNDGLLSDTVIIEVGQMIKEDALLELRVNRGHWEVLMPMIVGTARAHTLKEVAALLDAEEASGHLIEIVIKVFMDYWRNGIMPGENDG